MPQFPNKKQVSRNYINTMRIYENIIENVCLFQRSLNFGRHLKSCEKIFPLFVQIPICTCQFYFLLLQIELKTYFLIENIVQISVFVLFQLLTLLN